jgi:plasmid maintenance system antidote protein VapI
MNFNDMRERLRAELADRIKGGWITERGLARLAGISQSHVHHVLCGKRGVSMEMADRLMGCLNMSLVDLMRDEDRSSVERLMNRYATCGAPACASELSGEGSL